MKLILESFKKFEKQILNEDADPAQLDPTKFPLPLSKVNPKTAKKYTRSGDAKIDKSGADDIINLKPGSMPVDKLKPSQSSMNIAKALGMVISMLDPNNKFSAGGDLGAFISKDGYIMDGHHRWIATSMIDPSLKVGGYIVDFPAKQLVAVLNSITKGILGIMKGKKASGGFEQFQPEPLKKQLESYAQKGTKHNSPEEVLEILEKFSGIQGPEAVEAAANKMSQNLSSLTMETPSWAPGRPDMPVIDPDIKPGAIKLAIQAMTQGDVDVNPPYGTGARQSTEDERERAAAGSEQAEV